MEALTVVWLFERGGERRELEIRRAATEGYEIVVRQPNGAEIAEWFPHVCVLVSRQAALAASWQVLGWRPHANNTDMIVQVDLSPSERSELS
jgi:hypothetical protein